VPVNYLIVVAGGVGSRMSENLPKQFIKINGKEIIYHTLKKFLRYDSNLKIIIAVHKDYKNLLEQILSAGGIHGALVCNGGETRFHSVKNALQHVTDESAVVGIHDAARPLVSRETIKQCYETALLKGNSIPAVSISETIRQVNDTENKQASRDQFKIIQTPQCFVVSKIKRAFEQAYSPAFTDDASVLEAAGEKINLVQGNVENIKITHPKDLIIAKALLENEQR
jgi:2-C-methyl-D-erythritol 4-phosphate cytidylyltransferase